MKVGGFQSGFHARVVDRSECKWPEYLICSHDCSQIIQLVSHVSGEVEFELCAVEAKRMAQVLLEAVGYNPRLVDITRELLAEAEEAVDVIQDFAECTCGYVDPPCRVCDAVNKLKDAIAKARGEVEK